MTQHDSAALAFTGERFTPECVREIWYEHYQRYAFALRLCGHKRVLDAACGEGYGSALLAGRARTVLGVDIAADAIGHASRRYSDRPNLAFLQQDVTRLDHLPAQSFDLIVSFETLEHLNEQDALLDGFERLLAPSGILLISTPDRRIYSDLMGCDNSYHVRELYREEFERLIDARFPARRLYAQRLLFSGLMWDLHGGERLAVDTMSNQEALLPNANFDGVYFVAACAKSGDVLQALPDLHLFSDQAQSVYAHYNDEIRKGIRAGGRIAELEAELAQLKMELSRGRP